MNSWLVKAVAPAVPTHMLETYWYFASERISILQKRLSNEPQPWTMDPILQTFKFTNAYRFSDRISQYLILHIITAHVKYSHEDVAFRILLFKLFNTIQTWEYLQNTFADIRWDPNKLPEYCDALDKVFGSFPLYSAAYIMPSRVGFERKHHAHLHLLWKMMQDGITQKLRDAKTMREGYMILRSYDSVGDFLAYQFITDINYSAVTDFTEHEFVVPGPGAKRGIAKCFSDLGGLTEAQIIERMYAIQSTVFEKLGLPFTPLFGRALEYIDCQNLFCETDKYTRVRFPEKKNKRIKQKFRQCISPVSIVLPEKWMRLG